MDSKENILGKRLKELRGDRSQKEIADFLGITETGYGHYERGSRSPDPKAIGQLADFFNVSTDYLLGRDNSKDTPEKAFESALSDNPELLEFWKELSQRDDLQLMFKQARKLSPESIRKVVEVIKLIEDKEAEE